MIQWLRSLLFVGQIYVAMPIIGLAYAPFAYFSKDWARACCKAYSRYVFWSARWMVGLQVEVRGTPPSGDVMIAAKHQSFLDVMMIFTAIPTGKFIMKKSILWTPVVGMYAKRIECVAVDRGKRGAAVRQMVEDVAAGRSEPGQLIIYSQGTRVAPGDKKPYKIGVGALYEELGQPCVPVATNVGVFWPRTGILRKPGLAVVEFLPEMPKGLSRDEFMTQLEAQVEERSNALMAEAGFYPDETPR